MLSAISGIENARDTRDKCIVECIFEETVSVSVDQRNTLLRSNGNVVVADTDYGAVFLVCGVDSGVSFAFAGVVG
jgi:hypothetical protein